jgi:hypothetical protein
VRTTIAAALALAGGVAAMVGSFLPWAEVAAGPFAEQAAGIEGWEGKATLLGGVVMAAAGVRVFLGSDDAISRLRVGAAIGGVATTAIGVFTALTARDQLLDAGGSDVPRAQLEAALNAGVLELAIGVGLYVVIAGGVQGAISALVAWGVRDGSATGSRAGLTGWAAPPPPPAPPPPSSGSEPL